MSDGFIDRLDAGKKLAGALEDFRGTDAIVLGLPRGGIVVGYAVALGLDLPLWALTVRKLGAPHNPELAIGAVSETGVQWLDDSIVREVGASAEYVEREVAVQVAEARRRQQEYAVGGTLEAVRRRTAILVDDGIATGATALVAVLSARGLQARQVVLATPLASSQAVRTLRPFVDRLVVLEIPDPFLAVGLHYGRFEQVSDAEVVKYLRLAGRAEQA